MSVSAYRVVTQPTYADATFNVSYEDALFEHLASLSLSETNNDETRLAVDRAQLQEFVNAHDFDISDEIYAALQADIDATEGGNYIEYEIF